MTFLSGQELAASDLENRFAALEESGILYLQNPSTNSDHTTTESFAWSATVTFTNAICYEALSVAAHANLTATSSATFRYRYVAGAGPVTITDTELYRATVDVLGTVRLGLPHIRRFQWGPATGLYTIGFSIQSTANTTRWYGDTNAKTHSLLRLR
jgi:hypothetical protein